MDIIITTRLNTTRPQIRQKTRNDRYNTIQSKSRWVFLSIQRIVRALKKDEYFFSLNYLVLKLKGEI